jgi:asparagine synthase (glutamine-hydrolysing)
MCGIAGIATTRGGRPPSESQVRKMCATIAHRGPDDEGIEVQNGVGIGMRRLAIIDLAGGNQPIYNEDRSIRIVFNGEIYNFKDLRQDLLARGHRFYTNTDTEVIIHSYEEYGDQFPAYLNGMFAFALHDKIKQKIVLVRDHLGIKPLFYYNDGTNLIWGSEIKAILASERVPRMLNYNALGEFLSWEYVPGDATLFAGIHKLLPGHILEWSLSTGKCAISEYWDVPVQDNTGEATISKQEWADRIDQKITECVHRQMVSDVPLGAFLSGGVDSSLVVASMGKAETFSIGFDDPSYNELAWARKVADHLCLNHKDDIIRPDVFELFEHLMYFMDDPIGDFSIFPTYLVSKHARKHVTVSLSGDGGDELFGGYETYVADQAAKIYSLLPSAVRCNIQKHLIGHLKPRPQKKGFINKVIRFTEGVSYPPELGHARWRLFLSDALRKTMFTTQALEKMDKQVEKHIADLFKRTGGLGDINRNLYVDVKSYLVDNCLVKMDRMSMAVSLEARVPLLDKELVELAFRVPDKLKVMRGRTKILLKKIASRYVPKECVYRPKEGFSIPIKNWLSKELLPLVNELLSTEKIRSQGIFRVDTVDKLKADHFQNRTNNSHILWSLIVFQAWCARWL